MFVLLSDTELLKWIDELTRQLHDPPTMNNPDHPGKMRTILTCGSQDAIYKVSQLCMKCLMCLTD